MSNYTTLFMPCCSPFVFGSCRFLYVFYDFSFLFSANFILYYHTTLSWGNTNKTVTSFSPRGYKNSMKFHTRVTINIQFYANGNTITSHGNIAILTLCFNESWCPTSNYKFEIDSFFSKWSVLFIYQISTFSWSIESSLNISMINVIKHIAEWFSEK